jgi:hypothetical protein
LSGTFENPGAIILTIRGEKKIPASETITSMMESRVKAVFASPIASSFDFFFRYSVKMGTKDMVRDPSAKRRLKRFGILKATKKASVAKPAPKNPATTMSLMKPNILLRSVARPTTGFKFLSSGFSVSI